MKKSRKEFIIKGHAAACSEWKANIEKEFPKLFKKDELEVGKWYKETTSNRMVCIREVSSIINGYGFGCEGWVSNEKMKYGLCTDWTPATDKEVETALIKEAKKRGFKEGVSFDCVRTNKKNCTLGSEEWEFEPLSVENSLSSVSSQWIYEAGKWATIIETITTIIETITKLEAEKQLNKTIID